MKLSSRRTRLLAGIVGGCAVAAAVATSAASASAAPPAAPKPTVLVNCSGAGQVKPHTYILTCADAGDILIKAHWVSWKDDAYGSATEHLHICYPSCAASTKYVNYPVLLVVWRAVAWPGHTGRTYFSRLTVIHTGSLAVPHFHKLPRTTTWDLSPTAG